MEIAKVLASKQIADFSETNAPKTEYGALVAFPHRKGAQLFEFALRDFQPEMKTHKIWYCSMGSTQTITDAFLALMREVFWIEGPPSISGGQFAAGWALEHAIKINPGGVNGPIRMAVLQNDSARLLAPGEMDEVLQSVHEACSHLRGFREQLKLATAPAVPMPPGKS